MEKLLSKKDVLEMLGIKESTLYSWVCQKKIPYIKLGKRTLRFREEDIIRWISGKVIYPQTAEPGQSIGIRRARPKSAKADDDVQSLVDNAKKDILKS